MPLPRSASGAESAFTSLPSGVSTRMEAILFFSVSPALTAMRSLEAAQEGLEARGPRSAHPSRKITFSPLPLAFAIKT